MKKHNIGIIGCGPRGLYALECLLFELARRDMISKTAITIIDRSDYPGAGSVWNPTQSDANWINVSIRGLESLLGRESLVTKEATIPMFPKFTHWVTTNHAISTCADKDIFLQRNMLGQYLSDRFTSLEKALQSTGLLKVVGDVAINFHSKDQKYYVETANSGAFIFDECLLTTGHLDTELDAQLSEWEIHSRDKACQLIPHPYASEIADLGSENTIALRGLGLSTIDIIRMLTDNHGVKFSKKKVYPFLEVSGSGETSCPTFVPFTLDGLPPMPKPASMVVDSFFVPSKSNEDNFRDAIKFHLNKALAPLSKDFLLIEFADSFTVHFASHFDLEPKKLHAICLSWLMDNSYQHEMILDTDLDISSYIQQAILMSMGMAPPTLDYCIGQFWRHLQPTMYELISYSPMCDSVMAEIVAHDDSTKRYSYGPPAESMIQLLALMESGIIDTNYVDNPEITVDDKGWTLNSGEDHISCNIMINSVLPSAQPSKSTDTLMQQMLKSNEIAVVSDDLGIDVDTDACVVVGRESNKNIAMLGRNTKGSVLGVDAILECFGDRPLSWAVALAERLKKSDAQSMSV